MTRYVIVPDRSEVWIDARSTLHPIHSRTAGLEGFIETEVGPDGRIDLSVEPKARLSLPVDRLRSGNVLEERELKRRIMARRFPTIDGELTTMIPDALDSHYRVSGRLTFRGETRDYEHEMEISSVDDATLRLTGEAVFDIRDFGMEPPRILVLRVEPEVRVTVDIIAVKEDADA